MSNLAVFSGECIKGICGAPAGFNDTNGEPLHVGDIVLTYTDDYSPDALTVIVSDDWTTYTDGTYRREIGPHGIYAMGIASVPMDGTSDWRVRKVKSYADCVPGEHWPAWGFSYRDVPASILAELERTP